MELRRSLAASEVGLMAWAAFSAAAMKSTTGTRSGVGRKSNPFFRTIF